MNHFSSHCDPTATAHRTEDLFWLIVSGNRDHCDWEGWLESRSFKAEMDMTEHLPGG